MKKLTTSALLFVYIVSLIAVPALAQTDMDTTRTDSTDTTDNSGRDSVDNSGSDDAKDRDVDVRTRTTDDGRDIKVFRGTNGKVDVRGRVVRDEDGNVRKHVQGRDDEGRAFDRRVRKNADGDMKKRTLARDAQGEFHGRRVVRKDDETRVREFHDKTPEELRKMRAKRKEMLDASGVSDEEVRKRKIARDRYDKAMERRDRARVAYDEVREKHRENRDGFEDVRDELHACEESGEDCSELRDQIEDRAKKHLYSAAEKLLTKLEEMAARVEGSEQLSEEQVKAALSIISGATAEIKEIMSRIEAAETKEELKAAAKELRSVWKRVGNALKKNTHRMVGKKVGLIVKRAQNMERKLLCALEGTDNVDVSALVDKFGELVDLAHNEFEMAKEAWEADDFESAKAHIKEAHALLREAHQVLKEVLPLIREAGGDFKACGKDRPHDSEVDSEVDSEE